MGTTAEKLNYLKETKTKIKNALETPSSTFRDYSSLIKKYIDNQPTKTVNDGVCGNAVDLPIKAINIDGNSEQETTDGRQLFDNTLKGYGRYGTIAKTIPTGVRLSVGLDVTVSDIIFGVYATINLSKYVGKTVRMKATFESNSSLKGRYAMGLCNSNGANRTLKIRADASGKEISFVIPNLETGQEYLGVWFFANSGGTGVAGDYVDYTNVIVTIDNEDMTYEPYTGGTPSPNPEYPQEIEVINGCNMIDMSKVSKNYYISSVNGSAVRADDSYNVLATDFIEVKEGEKYYFSGMNLFNNGNSGAMYNSKKEFVSGILSDYDIRPITIPSGVKYLRLSIWGNKYDVPTNPKPVLVKSTTQKTYLSFGCIGLEQSGKNLYNQENFLNANNWIKNTDSYYTGTANDLHIYINTNKNYIVSNFKENTQYSINLKGYSDSVGGNFRFVFKYTDGTSSTNYILNTITESDYRVISQQGKTISYITTDYGSQRTLYIKDFMLKEVNIGNDYYESYHEPKVIEINLNGNTLAKVGDIKDILKVNRNGEVEIKKNIGKVVLDGSNDEKYIIATSNKFILDKNCDKGKLFKDIKNDNTKITAISNKLTGIPWDTMNDLRQGWYISIRQDGPFSYLRLLTTDIETGEDLKLSFQEHPAEVYYELATPQIITLPSISPIELWQGINIFKLITNLDTTFEVEYVVNKDSVLNEVQTAEVENNIESTKEE